VLALLLLRYPDRAKEKPARVQSDARDVPGRSWVRKSRSGDLVDRLSSGSPPTTRVIRVAGALFPEQTDEWLV
jgi:hypothetical protein